MREQNDTRFHLSNLFTQEVAMILIIQSNDVVGCIKGRVILECHRCSIVRVCPFVNLGFITEDADKWLQIGREMSNGEQFQDDSDRPSTRGKD